jgi:microcystin degradation protein MlrC
MRPTLRVAYARVAQESNAFSPVLTELVDFERAHYHDGEELARRASPDHPEVEGLFPNAEVSGFVRALHEVGGGRVEPIPLFSAWALPGGPLSAKCFAFLRDRLVSEVRSQGPLDAVMLSLHGAMVARGSEDPEADLVDAVREVVGPDVPIAVTLDLHAQLTDRFVAQVDVLTAYRTNPHRDHDRTGFRCGEMLTHKLLGKTAPVCAWRSLPLICGGGTTIDFLPTMRPVYRWMKRKERDPRVLGVSLFNSHLWNDSPELGWATHVVTDGAPELAEELAEELAQMLWDRRHKQPPPFPSAPQAVQQVRAASLRRMVGTICVCDASDIVGCGAAGENTRLLATVLQEGEGLLTLAPIRDAEVVAELWPLDLGSPVRVSVGGKLHPELNDPLEVCGTLLSREESRGMGRMVALDLGHVKLVVTTGPCLAMRPEFYTNMGLSPWKADMVVVKSMFPFRWYFRKLNRKTIYARTRGVTDFDYMHRLKFHDPVFPRDPVEDWRPTDRRRRGLSTGSGSAS